MRWTRNTKFVQIVRKVAFGQIKDVKMVKYKALPYLIFIFPGFAYWNYLSRDFDAQWLKTRNHTITPLRSTHDGRPHLSGQIPQNRQNGSCLRKFK